MTKRDYYRPGKPPNACHPLITTLFMEMEAQRMTIVTMARRAGIAETSITRWKHGSQPLIGQLEACFNVLGATLIAHRN